MLFNTLQFLIFFTVVVALFFAIPHRFRWLLLLASSYYFYMCFKPEYVVLIIFTTLICYYTGLQMGKQVRKDKRKKYLLISLFSCFGMLILFKYFNICSDSVRALFNHYNIFYGIPAFKIILPIGISFYTFQTLSYTIDVYRGHKKPEKHLGIFALYVSFFPQLVAGPIERSTSLLPQFYQKKNFDYDRIVDGLKLMFWGFFKKLVIADRLAMYVNAVYNHPADYHGLPLIIATYFFTIQIYCDFSGYSDIAIGASKVMGYNIMDNFKLPYFSQSIAEFWRRWHISLSTWFRDYLYIPLGGNRVSQKRWHFNILTVFLLCGLWHGIHPKFIVWGGLHGLYILFARWTVSLRSKICDFLHISKFPTIHKFLKVCITFHLVAFAWIFFRANSFSDAFIIISNIFKLTDLTNQQFLVPIEGYQAFLVSAEVFAKYGFIVSSAACLLLLRVQWIQQKYSIRQFLSAKPLWFKWTVYYILIFTLLIFGRYTSREFIYFQF